MIDQISTPIESWRDSAACRDLPADVVSAFIPYPDPVDERTAEAKSYCSKCPVAEFCLAEAVAENRRIGIFGGLTVVERDALAANA